MMLFSLDEVSQGVGRVIRLNGKNGFWLISTHTRVRRAQPTFFSPVTVEAVGLTTPAPWSRLGIPV